MCVCVCNVLHMLITELLTLFCPLPLCFQSHCYISRTNHFQGCSGPTALWAGRWVAVSGTTPISTFMPAVCASCTCRLIYVLIGITTLCVQVHRCAYSYLPPPHSRCCPSHVWDVSVDKTMAMMCGFLMMAAVQHFRALFYRLMMLPRQENLDVL